MEEIWKDIKGYEGKYQISSHGNVKSLNYNRTGKEHLLIQSIDKHSYHSIHLCLYGKYKCFFIHRLVSEAFIPNPDNLPCVNHKDENKHNNHVDNLEWCTHKYNNEYGTRLKRVSESLLNNPYTSNKVYQYTLDGKFVKEWKSTRECARNGFNQGAVFSCCIGERKTHKGYIWSYKKKESF